VVAADWPANEHRAPHARRSTLDARRSTLSMFIAILEPEQHDPLSELFVEALAASGERPGTLDRRTANSPPASPERYRRCDGRHT
jgi:hypothetical protein